MTGTDAAGRRAYRSDVRDAQAQATRRAVVTAAAELFVEGGYAGTTIDAVAQRAGVSRKTVFDTVDGGKPRLLKLAWVWALAGDDEPVAMAERPAVRRMQRATDPAAVVRSWAHLASAVAARAAPIGRVVAAAADVDPEVAELWRVSEQQRLTGATMFVRSLKARGWLRRGLSVRRAADIVWVTMDPSTYRRMVDERGWSQREHERWLRETVTAMLLTP